MRYVLALAAGLIAAGAIAIIGLKVRDNSNDATTVQRTTPGIVVVQPPPTPLRDSIREPARKKAAKGSKPEARKVGSPTSQAKFPARKLAKPPKRSQSRSPAKKPPVAHSPPRRPTAPTAPPTPPQTTNPRPPVDLTAPAPFRGCVKGIGGLNCP